MYVNYTNPGLNPHKQYTFLRNFGKETILIAVNFSGESHDLKINIPKHAFEFLGLKEGNFTATELLTGEKCKKSVTSDSPFETAIAPYDAVMWKFTQKNVASASKKIEKQTDKKGKK